MIVNILLTFSQFEQELISERVRDNIRARKRRGKWSGGIPPVGYISVDGELQIVEEEAEIVRFIYAEFLRGGSYMAAKRAVQTAGYRTAVKPMKKASTQWGGRLISSGHVYAILHNPIYVGEIRGHESTYPGTHEAIISRETWDAARSLSAERKRKLPHSKQTDHFLPGLLWDSLGRRMLLTIEKDRQPLHHGDRRVARASLEIADIGPVDPCAVGEIFLAPAPFIAKAAQIGSEALADIHCKDVPPMSPIRLQTMSDNRLDFASARSVIHVSHSRHNGLRNANLSQQAPAKS